MPDTSIYKVDGFLICGQCLDGAGGECHNPGCALIRSKAPDIPIRPALEHAGATIEKLDDLLDAADKNS